MSFSLSGGSNSLFPTRLLILISVFNNSRLLSLHQIQWMFDFLKTGTSQEETQYSGDEANENLFQIPLFPQFPPLPSHLLLFDIIPIL